MKRFRYGKLNIIDYITSWFGVLVLIFFSLASFIIKLHLVFVIFPLVYAVVWLMVILIPHCERFVLGNEYIDVFSINGLHRIDLPSKYTIIVSEADICPPLAVRTIFGNETHVLKKKYAISILREISTERVMEALQAKHIKKYTNSMIENLFPNNFIYSFVYDESQNDELLFQLGCQIIVPRTIVGKVELCGNVCIDENR